MMFLINTIKSTYIFSLKSWLLGSYISIRVLTLQQHFIITCSYFKCNSLRTNLICVLARHDNHPGPIFGLNITLQPILTNFSKRLETEYRLLASFWLERFLKDVFAFEIIYYIIIDRKKILLWLTILHHIRVHIDCCSFTKTKQVYWS